MKTLKARLTKWAVFPVWLCLGLGQAQAFYDPGAQRWINRDPIGERGGRNLYVVCRNNPSAYIDSFGLFGDGIPPDWKPPVVIHSPKGEQVFGECRVKPPCKGHNNFPGGIWAGGEFDYAAFDRIANGTSPWPIIGRPDLHFLQIGAANTAAEEALKTCDRKAFAEAMHQGQDHFSHVKSWSELRHPIFIFIKGYPGCHWNPGNLEFGHWLWLDAPDRNMDAWNEAAAWTAEWLEQWKVKCASKKEKGKP